ncbi:MAG: fumarate hydratase [Deltaproteobacteria bacterium]|nr:fumarate hydratase [Deltaproteobacteria bacterium]
MAAITADQIYQTACALMLKGATQLPASVMDDLMRAFDEESYPPAKAVLYTIIENCIEAFRQKASACQDIGIPAFTVGIDPQVPIACDLQEVLAQAVRDATASIPLRKNAIDPFSFKNTGDNTGVGAPFFSVRLHNGGGLRLRVEFKGFGGEIKSSYDWIFTTAKSMEKAVLAYTLNSVLLSKGEACTPGYYGIGIGGYAVDGVAAAKQAFFRSLSADRVEDPALVPLEQRVLRAVNRLGLGPMGGGGDTTCLGVFISRRAAHTATAPIALIHQCYSSRGSEAEITPDGVRYLTPHIEAAQAGMLRERIGNLLDKAKREGKIHELTLPLTPEQVGRLKMGDLVFLTGTVCTARDMAHRRMLELIEAGRAREIPAELQRGRAIFHCGPVVKQEGERWRVTSAGPTTSSRLTHESAVLARAGVASVIIGKGTLGPEAIQAMRGRTVYLKAVGGCAVSYMKAIRETTVQWLDLGPPEAMWIFEVDRLGPLVVGIDAEGHSLSERVMDDVYTRIREVYEAEGLSPTERYIQHPNTLAGLSLEEVIAYSKKH